MLRNSFYTIIQKRTENNSTVATISFDAGHQIFKGHFPGHPVVPGVCMMQIVREILEDSLQRELRIVGGDNLKFLSIINPEQNPQVDVSVNYTSSGNQWMVNAALSAGTVTFFKFKGTLQNT